MKLDDLILREKDNNPLSADQLAALASHGFTAITYQIYQSLAYYSYITGFRADGTYQRWTGNGVTPEEAEASVVQTVNDWLMQTPISGATP